MQNTRDRSKRTTEYAYKNDPDAIHVCTDMTLTHPTAHRKSELNQITRPENTSCSMPNRFQYSEREECPAGSQMRLCHAPGAACLTEQDKIWRSQLALQEKPPEQLTNHSGPACPSSPGVQFWKNGLVTPA
jgi:hypothetical protein